MQKNFNPVVSNLDFVCTNCKNLQFLYYRLHEMQKKDQEKKFPPMIFQLIYSFTLFSVVVPFLGGTD